MLKLDDRAAPFGVYIHVPFCSQICHYCDFAKTSRWDRTLVQEYFRSVSEHSKIWLELLFGQRTSKGEKHCLTSLAKTNLNFDHRAIGKISSLNFGGGTPGLFCDQYESLLRLFSPWLTDGAEVSLEVNPCDIGKGFLDGWRELGFNRLSIGVQTFDQSGLSFLHRNHSGALAIEKAHLARSVFGNINIDLIYGWPGQRLKTWQKDLANLSELSPEHISLYELCYAQKTPIGRAMQRGKTVPQSEDNLLLFYNCAREFLSEQGYMHDEVSNWAKDGFTCRHNWLYWENGYYLGVGPGAHGFLPNHTPQGLRYQYKPNERVFSRSSLKPLDNVNFLELFQSLTIEVEECRGSSDWLLEYLASALRTRKGVDLGKVTQQVSFRFHPSPLIRQFLLQKILKLENNCLVLSPTEWYYEHQWIIALEKCFQQIPSAG